MGPGREAGVATYAPFPRAGFFTKAILFVASLTWKDLATELGVNAFSFHRWRRLDGALVEPDLEDGQAFKAQCGLVRVRATPKLAALKAELLREQLKRERSANARGAGQSLERRIVDEMLEILAQKPDLLLRPKLKVELEQKVAEKSAAEIIQEGMLNLDETREVMNANIATLETDLVKPPPGRSAPTIRFSLHAELSPTKGFLLG